MISKIVLCMHNVEVFVNYDPPCNSVSTARRLNKRSKKKKKKKEASGWTGIKISFRNEVQVAQDVIG